MILVDSCMYIDWMREGVNPVQRLHARRTELVSCGIIHLEVLRGIAAPRVKAYMADFFDLLPQVPLTADLIQAATDLAWAGDRNGIVLPVTDVLIAACSLQVGATLITRDAHFLQVPDLRVRNGLD